MQRRSDSFNGRLLNKLIDINILFFSRCENNKMTLYGAHSSQNANASSLQARFPAPHRDGHISLKPEKRRLHVHQVTHVRWRAKNNICTVTIGKYRVNTKIVLYITDQATFNSRLLDRDRMPVDGLNALWLVCYLYASTTIRWCMPATMDATLRNHRRTYWPLSSNTAVIFQAISGLHTN